MAKAKKAVLIVNLGTPDSPTVPDVRKYLREFLMDKRVIDIPFIPRWMLVNLIIATFRAPKSARVYQKLWEDRGSPLMFYGEDVKNMLQTQLGEDYYVELAMRYQNPGIAAALEKIKAINPSKILVIPMFPQYASATTGSVSDKVMEIVRTWQVIPEIEITSQFLEKALFIEAFTVLGKNYLNKTDFDHILFSYHGLPERQIRKASYQNYCELNEQCCGIYTQQNRFCYRAQCFQTSRLLADKLNIPKEKYSVIFQSRLGNDPWLRPYAEEVIKRLPGEGKKKVLIFCPSFVADCLETTVEVGGEFRQYFLEAGGEHWQLVESLNNNPTWVKCLEGLVQEHFS